MAHIQMNYFSNALKRSTDVQIFLPSPEPDDYLFGDPGKYRQPGKKYQALYLLHGSYDDGNSWSRKASIERYAQEHCIAVIMPSVENSMYVNMEYGDCYETFIAEELPAFAEKMLPISGRREDRFIAGLSMGGGGAFRMAFLYPEKYAAAASLSGGVGMKEVRNSAHLQKMPKSYLRAVGKKKDVEELIPDCVPEELPRLYMTCGTEDFILPGNRSFYEAAVKKGIDVVYEEHPGVHSWEFWDQHIQDVLRWFPLKRDMV